MPAVANCLLAMLITRSCLQSIFAGQLLLLSEEVRSCYCCIVERGDMERRLSTTGLLARRASLAVKYMRKCAANNDVKSLTSRRASACDKMADMVVVENVRPLLATAGKPWANAKRDHSRRDTTKRTKAGRT